MQIRLHVPPSHVVGGTTLDASNIYVSPAENDPKLSKSPRRLELEPSKFHYHEGNTCLSVHHRGLLLLVR